MDNFEKDGVPVLSETHVQVSDKLIDYNFRRPVSRTKNVAISIPMISMESHQNESSLKEHTSPLCSERKNPLMQMSNPLYGTHGTRNLLQQTMVVKENKVSERKTEKNYTFHGTGERHWNSNSPDKKNEHLWKSGELGMCDDPYCTTCPTDFKASRRRNSKVSTVFDPKVSPS